MLFHPPKMDADYQKRLQEYLDEDPESSDRQYIVGYIRERMTADRYNIFGYGLKLDEYMLLDKVPPIPEHFTYLICTNTNITSLPDLPNNIESMYLDDTYISELPKKLPSKLRILSCNGCSQLKSLPELPDTLEELYLKHTQISELPERLPPKLVKLGIRHTSIIINPETVPKSLTHLYLNRKGLYVPADRWSFIYINHPENPTLKILQKHYDDTIRKARIIQRCKAIKQELMAVTWHTDRVLDWCDPNAFSWED